MAMITGCHNKPADDSNRKRPGIYRVETETKETVHYSLTDEQTKYLWDMEHHANILGKHGFAPLLQAIISSSREKILDSIGEPECLIVDETGDAIRYQSELLDLKRVASTETIRTKDYTTEEFVDWILEKRDLFSEDPRPQARFDVKNIFPPQENEYWIVDCIHRLWGTAKSGGPLEVTIHMQLKTYEIEKQRLDLGSWINRCEITQVDVFQSKKPLFSKTNDQETRLFSDSFHDNWKDVRKEINTGGIYACDYNRDGLADLFVTDLRQDAGKLYTGKPQGKFAEETYFLQLELAKNCRIAAFVDIDNDGWEDVFFPSLPRIFRNLQGEKFANYTGQTNLPLMLDLSEGESKRISGIIPADYDLDGDMDLYITRSVESVGSWLESVQPHLAHNQLLRNDGNWTFTDVTQRTGTNGEGRSSFSAVWTDVNNDRYPDLYVINEFGNGSLLINEKGKRFKKTRLTEDQNDFGSMGLTCGDYDNDGNIDIYVSNMYSKAGSRVMGNMKKETYPDTIQNRLKSMVAGGELYQNQGNLQFNPVGKQFQVHAAGWAWGSSLADLNNDGWLDLYVTAGFISRDREKPDG
jgi:hypothetical protein